MVNQRRPLYILCRISQKEKGPSIDTGALFNLMPKVGVEPTRE